MMLLFENVEFVFLLVCEIGIGIDGLEYCIIVYVFVYVGVQVVMVIFWQVDDEVICKFVEKFY